jgi:hypothetical protein
VRRSFRKYVAPTIAFSLLSLLWISSAGAECADDVGGLRVACKCGDLVVGDVHLRSDDPVVSERCLGDGLIVRAAPDAATVVVDLSGLTLVGQGFGTGLRVIFGGKQGAQIRGGSAGQAGEIVGFDTGLSARGARSVAEVRDLVLRANRRDGLRLTGQGTRIVNVSAYDNGKDGLRVRSHGMVLEGVESAGNARAGVHVTGESAQVQGRSRGNGKEGIRASGRGHDLSGVETGGNAAADVGPRRGR